LGNGATSSGTGIAIGLNSTASTGIAIGEAATSNVITTTSVGWSAGRVSTAAAIHNSLYGYGCGFSLTSGTQNTASGSTSLYWNNTGGNNCAYGFNSMGWNAGLDPARVAAVFNNNSCFGQNTMLFQRSGDFNVASGVSALRGSIPSAVAPTLNTANSNVAVGAEAMNWVQTATENCAVGRDTLKFAGIASSNCAFGHQSIFCNTTYNTTNNIQNNTACGYQSLHINLATATAATLNNNTAFGYQCMQNTSPIANNNIGMGSGALRGSSGNNNIVLGVNAAATLTAVTGINNILIGNDADVNSATALNRIAVGRSVVNNTDNSLIVGGVGANNI